MSSYFLFLLTECTADCFCGSGTPYCFGEINKCVGKLCFLFEVTSKSKMVQAGKDQEKAQSEKDPHSKNRDWKKN